MNEVPLKEKIIALFKKKKEIEKEIEKLRDNLVKQLCPKHKHECEPAYCIFRITNTCPFLKIWREILKESE